MNEQENINPKFTREEETNLIELGMYMRAEILRQNLEEQLFKREQGI